MNNDLAILRRHGLVIRDGLIADIGPWERISRNWLAPRTLGDSRAIILPGLIDAHTHCTQCFVRSLTANELPMIPRIYNPATRSLSAAQANTTARLLAAQLLRAGVTTLCEGCLNPAHEEAILEAFTDVGIRCAFARGAADQDFSHAALYSQIHDRSWVKAREGVAERELLNTERYLKRYPAHGNGLIRAAVNVSALPGFSADYFVGGARLAKEHNTTFQVHASRDREEVEFCLSVWGRRPIERLADLGVISDHLVVAHGVLASESEIDLLGQGNACLVHSPIESVNNMNAVPNIQRFRSAGVRVAFGCDNQANDMLVNMRVAWMVQSALWGLPRYDPTFLDANTLISMATTEAARALRWDDMIGSLELGKGADLIVLDGRAPHLMSLQDLPSDIVRYATRAEIVQTVVAGQILYDEGDFPTIDIERLAAESEVAALSSSRRRRERNQLRVCGMISRISRSAG
jgi:5-methylthioadenosine/S-adenosylhomocysteine deaminase